MKRLFAILREWKSGLRRHQKQKKEEPPPFSYGVDRDLLPELQAFAQQEDVTVEEMAKELLYFAVNERRTAEAYLQLWRELTPREQETAALVCLGYTNRQIADRMIISTNTVKTHIRNILFKFELNSKSELKDALSGWDWSGTTDDR